MSIDIDWSSFTKGEVGEQLASRIREFLDDRFQEVTLPKFIRDVKVESFAFGNESPSVELKDLSDPIPDFYVDEDEDEDEDVDESETVEHETENDRGSQYTSLGEIESAAAGSAETLDRSGASGPHRSRLKQGHKFDSASITNSDDRYGDVNSGDDRPEILTPGIPGGTSNLNYFHLPLGMTLNGTPSGAATPFSPAWPLSSHDSVWHKNLSSLSIASMTRGKQSSSAQPSGKGIAAVDSKRRTSQSSRSSSNVSDPMDLQLTLKISYSGSMSVSLTAEILLDYPMPSFVAIPFKLKIIGIDFEGIALLAYLNPARQKRRQEEMHDQIDIEQCSRKLKFCFLGDEAYEIFLNSDQDSSQNKHTRKSSSSAHSSLDSALRADSEGLNEGPLRHIRIESEIGCQDDGRQALKNVGKIERFIVNQIRRIFEEEFVFPSFYTFLL